MLVPEARITDREFLGMLKNDLVGTQPQEVLDRLQLVIDRLEPQRLLAAVRAYEKHILSRLEEGDDDA